MSESEVESTRSIEIDKVRDGLRAAGMRWTPQRRVILEALLSSAGDHVTGSEIVARVQAVDSQTPPSTVYRTLDALEGLGYVSHSHGRDGREEYHVMPDQEHAHIVCEQCGDSWNVSSTELAPLVRTLASKRGFETNLSHLTVSGVCERCAGARRAEVARQAASS